MTSQTPTRTDALGRVLTLLLREDCAVVLVHGPVGSGKSHLLQSLARRMRQDAGGRVLLVSGSPGCPPPPGDVRRDFPIVIADDLDRWAPSARGELSAAVDRGAVQVVATVRSRGLADLLADFRPACTPALVALQPCSPEALQAYAERTLGGHLHAATARRLVGYAGGNRLCLHELLHEGRATGRLTQQEEIWAWRGSIPLPPVTRARIWGELVGLPEPVLDVLVSLAGAQGSGTAAALDIGDLAATHPRDALQDAETLDVIRVDRSRGPSVATLCRPVDGWVALAGVPSQRRAEILARTARRLLALGAPERGYAVATARLLHESGEPVPADLVAVAAVESLGQRGPGEAASLLRELGSNRHPRHLLAAEIAQGRIPVLPARPGSDPLAPVVRALLPAAATPDPLASLASAAWTGTRPALAYAQVRDRLAHCAPSEFEILLPLALWIGLQAGRIVWCIETATRHRHQIDSFRAPARLSAIAGLGMAQLLAGDLDAARAIGLDLTETGIGRHWPVASAVGEYLLGRSALEQGLNSIARRRLAECVVSGGEMDPVTGMPSLARAALELARARAGAAGSEHHQGDRTGAPPLVPRIAAILIELVGAERDLARDDVTGARAAAHRVAEACRLDSHPLGLLLATHLLARCSVRAGSGPPLQAAAAAVEGPWAALAAAHGLALATGDAKGLAAVAASYRALGSAWLGAETAAVALAYTAGRHPGWTLRARRLIDELATHDDVRLPAWWGRAARRAPALTAREEEIARAAGAGRTSRAIAADLGLSTRTVDNHLHNVFRKLGITTRTQLRDSLTGVVPTAPRSTAAT